MTYAALCFAFVSGALAADSLMRWIVMIDDPRPSAALGLAAAVAAVLMVAL
jgi:hypothetical protein